MVPITGFNLDLYEDRLAEWDALLASAQSDTLRNLFQQVRVATEHALRQFTEVQRMSLVIMAANKITFEKSMTQYTAQVQQVNQEIKEANAARTYLPGMADYFSDLIHQVQVRANKEKAVYDLSLKVYSLAIAQFQGVLELIYQPRNGSFHYESIMDAFQYVTDKVLPGLSEFRSIRHWVPSIRKKTFAQTGDKLLIYIEQYQDVLAKWEELAGAYIQLLNE